MIIQVSNGAEVVMLSKEFLLEHFTETISNKLKHQVSEELTCRKHVREIVVLADYTVSITRGNAEENKRALLMEHLQAEHC